MCGAAKPRSIPPDPLAVRFTHWCSSLISTTQWALASSLQPSGPSAAASRPRPASSASSRLQAPQPQRVVAQPHARTLPPPRAGCASGARPGQNRVRLAAGTSRCTTRRRDRPRRCRCRRCSRPRRRTRAPTPRTPESRRSLRFVATPSSLSPLQPASRASPTPCKRCHRARPGRPSSSHPVYGYLAIGFVMH
ncbi:hypothetical protein PYCCODRAFT_1439687 [Trametes coccinea BRFM310]|uniref:Uncharacterized protein n=1 Tax=Trametes coccinea (strain BRFM310) TaxID=1353009 RepID=A0A1Y2IDQ4_TRAC3|nr:hypothetical protein PYCCODRAFT_1439687 [Trametes coccinea BRFM310]